MKIHIDSVHEGKKPFKCNICKAIFAGKRDWNKHVASVHEEKRPFKCTICDANFAKKGNFKRHVTSVHEGKKPHRKGSLQKFMKERIPLNAKF